MRNLIAPSILSFDHSAIGPRVEELIAGGAELIHIDVMDGRFVPPITFGDGLARGLCQQEGPLYEAHLMIVEPEAQFKRFVDAGCGRVIFHAEATEHAHRLVGQLLEMGVRAGVAINPGTPVEAIKEIVHLVDLVLVMTVNPGWGGQHFIAKALDKVAQIRGMRENVEIEVDGGVDETTLRQARAAGANLFVVGSHLLAYPSLGDAMRELSACCA